MTDKTPRKRKRPEPSDKGAELNILGGLLTDPTLMGEVERVLQVEDFFFAVHRAIYTLMRELLPLGPVDEPVLVSAALERGEHEYGGVSYLCMLRAHCPSVGGVVMQAVHVRNLAVRREVLAYGSRVRQAAVEALEVTEMLGVVDAGAAALRRPVGGESGWVSVGTLAGSLDAELRERVEGTSAGASTGLTDLDHKLRGLRRGDLYILGARPSVGKTGLAAHLARTLVKANLPVAFFELEMSPQELRDKLLSSEGEVLYERILSGELSESEIRSLAQVAEDMRAWPLWIEGDPSVGLADIRMRVRRLRMHAPALALVIVDYIQLCRLDVRRGETRATAIGEVSRGLKMLAREENVAVLALSQLNRSSEGREDNRPKMGDLRESGNLEADADAVLLMYRDELYNADSPDKGTAEIIVAKNRKGKTGKVRVAWEGAYQRFRNLATGWAPPPMPEPKKGRRRHEDEEPLY